MTLRSQTIRFAYEHPELRDVLLPMVTASPNSAIDREIDQSRARLEALDNTMKLLTTLKPLIENRKRGGGPGGERRFEAAMKKLESLSLASLKGIERLARVVEKIQGDNEDLEAWVIMARRWASEANTYLLRFRTDGLYSDALVGTRIVPAAELQNWIVARIENWIQKLPESLEETNTVTASRLDEVLVRGWDCTVADAIRRLNRGGLKFSGPTKTTGDRARSLWVESVLMRLPLPALYAMEDRDGTPVIVSGRGRLEALQGFIAGEFSLDLPDSEFNGYSFDELPPRFQGRIEDTKLSFHILDARASESVREDFAQRVNR